MKFPRFDIRAVIPISISIIIITVLYRFGDMLDATQAELVFIIGLLSTLIIAAVTFNATPPQKRWSSTVSDVPPQPIHAVVPPSSPVDAGTGLLDHPRPFMDDELEAAMKAKDEQPYPFLPAAQEPEDLDRAFKRMLLTKFLTSDMSLDVSVTLPANLFGTEMVTDGKLTFRSRDRQMQDSSPPSTPPAADAAAEAPAPPTTQPDDGKFHPVAGVSLSIARTNANRK